MKTATVRELRNNFASLAKWIEHGEEITMTRNGQTFATLSPARSEQRAKGDWAARFAKRKPLGKGSKLFSLSIVGSEDWPKPPG